MYSIPKQIDVQQYTGNTIHNPTHVNNSFSFEKQINSYCFFLKIRQTAPMTTNQFVNQQPASNVARIMTGRISIEFGILLN